MIALDTNILVYAVSPGGDPRHAQAAAIMERLFLVSAIIPLQVLGEFLNVAQRKTIIDSDIARQRVEEWLPLFDTAVTDAADLLEAARVSRSSKIQFFDALICTIAGRSGARHLLSEDIQDGMVIGTLTILNPFNPTNQDRLDALIKPLR
ncbi:PIN domain-containing protein [Sphingobium boeckii]|uniref:Putative nucleic acid-binding protein n=1 Tax=Sphingobium boeckii TaxID=1082345 RepID=A0A7W9AGV3_9SPHN|nr:PIN domain-containing protein [Sphingobium boeckii]MBB5685432.1 putative nucleic acid-binding protein [Sphingobium boeckii]